MNSHNYNKDFNPRFFGQDSVGKSAFQAPPAPKTQQQPAQQQTQPKTKAAPEYRITNVEIVVPSDGLKKDQPFDIQGTVQPLAGAVTKKKLRIELVTRYKGTEDRIGAIEADIEKDNSFNGTYKQLFCHDGFQRDKDKPSDAKFTLEAKASGTGAEKEAISKPVELPMAASTVILKKGKYDDTWVKDHAATHPKSGKEYVADNKIKKLQENLVQFRFFKNSERKERITGFFDEATHKAVWDFQDYARKPDRKKGTDTRIIKAEKVTLTDEPDGEVGPNTEKEIALWLQNNWVKPEPEFRKDDVDDNGVRNKHGERGGEKHHPGTDLTDVQKLLADIGAYAGKIDGRFFNNLEKALSIFHDHAVRGEFVDAQGKKVMLDKKDWLKDYRKGVINGDTIKVAEKVKEKGLKVAAQPQPATKNVKELCEKQWDAHKNNCSGFVNAVAKELKVTLTGKANDIIDQIQKKPWKVLKDGTEANAEAKAGKFVVAGLKEKPNGHVVIIVPGELVHGKYPTAYWGHLGSVGFKNTTINYAWKSTERDKVTYASIQL